MLINGQGESLAGINHGYLQVALKAGAMDSLNVVS
jgi:hypothetical protein